MVCKNVQSLEDRRRGRWCRSSNDIGRACDISHAEQVAGERKYGSRNFYVSWLELATLEFERFSFFVFFSFLLFSFVFHR